MQRIFCDDAWCFADNEGNSLLGVMPFAERHPFNRYSLLLLVVKLRSKVNFEVPACGIPFVASVFITALFSFDDFESDFA